MSLRILVPYDFSPCAEKALAFAAELHRLGGGSLLLLYTVVLPPISAAGELPVLTPSHEQLERLRAELREAAARHVPDARVEVTSTTDPAGEIVHQAGAWQAELIVMGTHGRGGLKRMMLGSVADRVIRSAGCPVATVRDGTT